MLNLVSRLVVVGLAALVFATTASADPDWYQVEIVVFANTAPDAGEAEFWPDDPGQPSNANAQYLSPPGTGGAYAQLAESQMQLGGVVSALRKSGSRRPILHIAWRQPVLERGKAQPVWIHGGPHRYLPDGRSVDEISGTLLLTRARFLHLWADLLYAPDASDGKTYRMQDHRRMRSGELHYIDHPKFGLLILCTPLQNGK